MGIKKKSKPRRGDDEGLIEVVGPLHFILT